MTKAYFYICLESDGESINPIVSVFTLPEMKHIMTWMYQGQINPVLDHCEVILPLRKSLGYSIMDV